MTKKGLYKLITQPNIFIKDYTKKNKKSQLKVKYFIEKAINLNVPSSTYYYKLYLKLNENKAFYLAEEALGKAISVKPTAFYYYKLAKILQRKNQWWRVVESYERAIKLDDNIEMKYYLEYVNALEKMERFEKICQILNPLAKNKKLNADGYFKYGIALEKTEQFVLSEEAFSKAIEKDIEYNSKELGIGSFYEKKGLWIPAVKAYAKSLKEHSFNANIQYKFGLSLERCYEWKQSEKEHLLAISLNSKSAYWYYKLGFVRERMGLFKKASEAYSYAVENKKSPDKYWYYRLAYTLRKAGEYQASCDAFLMIKNMKLFINNQEEKIFSYDGLINNIEIEEYFNVDTKSSQNETIFSYDGLLDDIRIQKELSIKKIEQSLNAETTITDTWKVLAKLYRDMGKYKESIEKLQHLLKRTNSFDENLYFELGEVLVLNGDYKGASNIFLEQRILQEAHGVSETSYIKDKALQKIIHYTEYYERHEIEDKTILYESYHGRSMSCNPYALFKEIYKDERFKDYTHIWAINNMEIIPKYLKAYVNIIFVTKESDLYLRYLTKAKYLINNTSFSDYFIRKEKQVYLNTWHGTPLKLMGKDTKDEFLSHKNITRNFLHTSHLIHPNRYTLDIMLESYDIKNIYEGVIAEIGYPRQDLMLNISNENKENLLEQMNIVKDKKVILYAPTWRGTGVSEVEFDADKLLEDLNLLSQLENVHVLYRGHYMAEKFIQEVDALHDTIVPSFIDTNSLLSIVDVLITDYSSIAFDFMALEKPIIYYAYDREEYAKERGFKFELEEISENICENNQVLFETLEKVLTDLKIDSKQIKAQEKFCAYDDGYASKRVIDLLFFDKVDEKYIVEFEKKESILFYGGPFIPNGITTSLLSLTSKINQDKFSITVVLEPKVIIGNDQKNSQLARLKNNINILGRFGRMQMTLEEKWIIAKLNSQNTLASSEMWNLLYKSYNREFLRVFGHIKFTNIINFEGYNSYWVRLFSEVYGSRNSIYLHNEMQGEAETRFPSLYGHFQIYQKYDNLISVSTDVDIINKINLVESYELSFDKFQHSDNLLNPKEVITKAEENLEFPSEEKLFIEGKVFINMARLSPEKDQKKLIYAFAKIVKKHKNSKLLILGQGPLKNNLETLVKKLSMKKNIFILGQRFNPMPYLKRMDCFVLSSNYEGQGLVLLEAMILGKPVISTDIVGPRSVLDGQPGLLVENSEEALYQGMLDFIENRYVEDKVFDYEEYNEKALNMFYTKVLDC